MINALNVANTFLEKAKKDNIDVTPMKLQKLIYILYKTYLQRTRTRLFSERFEVWQYGPVISDVYQAFKSYRSNIITDFYLNNDGSYTTVAFKTNPIFDDSFSYVWERYSRFSGTYLSQLTHQQGSAWSIADQSGNLFLNDEDIFGEEEYLTDDD